MKTWLTCALLTLTCYGLRGADDKTLVKNALERVHKKYSAAKTISSKVKHTFYKNHGDKTAAQEYEGFYRREGNKVHSMLMGIETIQDGKSRLVVDTANRSAIYTNASAENEVPTPDLNLTLKLCSKVIYKDSSGSISVVLLFDKNKFPCSRIEITINNDLITKLVLYHTETTVDEDEKNILPRTEIEFSDIKLGKNLPESEFKQEELLQKSGQTITTKGRISGFTFTNIYLKD